MQHIVFKSGRYAGARWQDVPQSYIQYLYLMMTGAKSFPKHKDDIAACKEEPVLGQSEIVERLKHCKRSIETSIKFLNVPFVRRKIQEYANHIEPSIPPPKEDVLPDGSKQTSTLSAFKNIQSENKKK